MERASLPHKQPWAVIAGRSRAETEAQADGAVRHTEDKDTSNHGVGKIAPLHPEFLNLYAHPLLFSKKAGVWEIRAEREPPYSKWTT